MGSVFIQPITNEPEDMERASLIVFPQRIPKEHLNVAVEWAASSQTPIFCHSADVKRFEAEGFGAYRFHRLEGYREVDFQGGSIEFYPARHKPVSGIKSIVQDMWGSLGLLRVPAFHVVLRPKGEPTLLYLASNHIDTAEWQALTKSRPELVIGADDITKHEWHALSLRLKRKIVRAAELGARISTLAPNRRPEQTKDNPAWPAKVGSF